jgi:hypothetical protein
MDSRLAVPGGERRDDVQVGRLFPARADFDHDTAACARSEHPESQRARHVDWRLGSVRQRGDVIT